MSAELDPVAATPPPTVRLAVVSDTHGHVDYTQDAVRMIEGFDVHCVIHCGDIGSVEIVRLFGKWPTHFVFGNVDGDVKTLRAAIQHAGQTCHDYFGTLELAGKRIAFLHGDDLPALDHASRSGLYDLVCHGHTHQVKQHREGNTLVLNPGALFRAYPHSLAIVELPAMQVTIVTI